MPLKSSGNVNLISLSFPSVVTEYTNGEGGPTLSRFNFSAVSFQIKACPCPLITMISSLHVFFVSSQEMSAVKIPSIAIGWS